MTQGITGRGIRSGSIAASGMKRPGRLRFDATVATGPVWNASPSISPASGAVGTTFTASIDVTGATTTSYQWFNASGDIDGATGTTHVGTIDDVGPSVLGVRVVAESAEGTTQRTARATVPYTVISQSSGPTLAALIGGQTAAEALSAAGVYTATNGQTPAVSTSYLVDGEPAAGSTVLTGSQEVRVVETVTAPGAEAPAEFTSAAVTVGEVVITEETAAVLPDLQAGDVLELADITLGTYSASNGATPVIKTQQLRVMGLDDVARDETFPYTAIAGETVWLNSTVGVTGADDETFSSPSILVDPASLPFAATSPQTFSLTHAESGSTVDVTQFFHGGTFPIVSLVEMSNDRPADLVFSEPLLAMGGSDYDSASVVIRGTDSDGATADLTVIVNIAAAPFDFTGSGTTLELTRGEAMTPYDLATLFGGGTGPYTIVSAEPLPTGVALSGNSLQGTPNELFVPDLSYWTFFERTGTDAQKLGVTLDASAPEAPSGYEYRLDFAPSLEDPIGAGAVLVPGGTYLGNFAWPLGSEIYARYVLREIASGENVQVLVGDPAPLVVQGEADATPPAISLTASASGATGYTGTATLNKIGGTVYHLAQPAADPAPNSTTVKTGASEAASSLNVALAGSGLTEGVTYRVYAVYVDSSGVETSVASSDTFTPAAAPAGDLTINAFTKDKVIFDSGAHLGRNAAEVPLSGTGVNGQTVEALISTSGTPLFASTEEAVLALKERTNPNGVQGSRSLLTAAGSMTVPAGMSRDSGQKRITINSGATVTVSNIDFAGWCVTCRGTLVADNCVFGNPGNEALSQLWPVIMKSGSRLDATYCSFESSGHGSNVVDMLIRFDPPATEADMVETNLTRCRMGGCKTDNFKPQKGTFRWLYIDPSVPFSTGIGGDPLNDHFDLVSIPFVHQDGVVFEACYLNMDNENRASDYPYYSDITIGAYNNVLRMGPGALTGNSYPTYGQVIIRDCVLGVTYEQNGVPGSYVETGGVTMTPAIIERCRWLGTTQHGDYWDNDESSIVHWGNTNTGPGGTLAPPGSATSITSDPAPSIASWGDPALGGSEVWQDVATVSGGVWSGTAEFPRSTEWYTPTVRVKGGDGTRYTSPTRFAAGHVWALHGQSNSYYPFNFTPSGQAGDYNAQCVSPPAVVNDDVLQIISMSRRQNDTSPQPAGSAYRTFVTNSARFNAGAALTANMLNEMLGGEKVLFISHALSGMGMEEEFKDAGTGFNADAFQIRDLWSADGVRPGLAIYFAENAPGAADFENAVGAMLFSKLANGTAFNAPGVYSGNSSYTIEWTLADDFYDFSYTKFAWISGEGSRADGFRAMAANPVFASYFADKHQGATPYRSTLAGYWDGTDYNNTGHYGLADLEGAPRAYMMKVYGMAVAAGVAELDEIPTFDRVRLHPNGNQKVVEVWWSGGDITTFRKLAGDPPASDHPDFEGVVREFEFAGSPIWRNEIRDASGTLATQGRIWLYKNDGSDWTAGNMSSLGYRDGNSWVGEVNPRDWLNGIRFQDWALGVTGNSVLPGLPVMDRYVPRDLFSNYTAYGG